MNHQNLEKKEKLLITTALEGLPDKGFEKIIFLGEWCRDYYKSSRFKDINFEVMPYPWDDRLLLEKDFQYLEGVYKKILKTLADNLNDYHKVKYPEKYWKTLIGIWLGWFLHALFERQNNLNHLDKNQAFFTYLHAYNFQDLPASDMEEFVNLLFTDEYNHLIYSELIKLDKSRFITERLESSGLSKNLELLKRSLFKETVIEKNSFKLLLKRFFSLFEKDTDSLFLNSNLSKSVQVSLKLLSFESISFPTTERIVFPKISKERKKFKTKIKEDDDFVNKVLEIIHKFMPVAYLEGYQSLVQASKDLPWPNRPKFILTANSFFIDELFKQWTAHKVNKGSKLIIHQHGGFYGFGKFNFLENFEKSISEGYMNWGWENNKNSFSLSSKSKKIRQTSKLNRNSLLLVLGGAPKYSSFLSSYPISPQVFYYLEDTISFYKNLIPKIQEETIVRLKKHNSISIAMDEIWLEKVKDVSFDEGEVPLYELVRSSKIFIGTQNATSYLEALKIDHPTVVFWDKNYWEPRKSAVDYLKLLEELKILHYDPVLAAKFINSIWEDVDSWWNEVVSSDDYQLFKNTYCKLPNNLSLSDIFTISKNLKTTSK